MKGRYENPEELPREILEKSHMAGMEDPQSRSASFFHIDEKTVQSRVEREFDGMVEVTDIKSAIKEHEWVRKLMFTAVPKDQDETTRQVSEKFSGGYFMHILEGADIDLPIQSCLMMTGKNKIQRVHNIIIAEPGSRARIISGCATSSDTAGSHLGVSEFFVKDGASLSFTMIHNWAEKMTVRPKSAAIIGKNASFVSNYICMQPVSDLFMYPRAYCQGEGSRARFSNIIYIGGKSRISAGSAIELEAEGSSGEIISRNIVKDTAAAIAPGQLIAKAPRVKAHMECRGLMLNDGALIHAIPELMSEFQDVEMSHEAAVGKIADKEINYLMSRGLSQDDATSAIVRGFLDIDILGLPKELSEKVESIVDSMVDGI